LALRKEFFAATFAIILVSEDVLQAKNDQNKLSKALSL